MPTTERAGGSSQDASPAEHPGGTRLGDAGEYLAHPVLAAWQALQDELDDDIPANGALAIAAMDATLHHLVTESRGDELDAVRFRTLVRETRVEQDEQGNVRLVAAMPPLPKDVRDDVATALARHLAGDARTIVRVVDVLREVRA